MRRQCLKVPGKFCLVLLIFPCLFGCGSTDDMPSVAESEETRKAREYLGVQAPTPESLVAVVRRWQDELNTADPDARVAAFKTMAPAERDIAVLFPDHKQWVNRFYAAKLRDQELAWRFGALKSLSQGRRKPAEITPIDMRTSSSAKSVYAGVLSVLPGSTPVYELRVKGGGDPGGPYVFVNDRWSVWTDKFDDIGEAASLLPVDGSDLSNVSEEQKKHVESLEREISRIEEQVARRQKFFGKESAAKEQIRDAHFGVLVYSTRFDERLSLNPVATYVRAVCRAEGNGIKTTDRPGASKGELRGARGLQYFGQYLRLAMTDDERMKYESLIKEGQMFGLTVKRDDARYYTLYGPDGELAKLPTFAGAGAFFLDVSKPPKPSPAILDADVATLLKVLEHKHRIIRLRAKYFLSRADLTSDQRRHVNDKLTELGLED